MRLSGWSMIARHLGARVGSRSLCQSYIYPMHKLDQLRGVSALLILAAGSILFGGEPTPPKPGIDATTLRHKVLCGYQGWFRCAGDPAGEGWRHWSRDRDRLTPDRLTFEMWPD